ncbi:MAG: hypothetical protein ACE5H4_06265 [Candidatus Thorarchaeota archaeon]
MTRDELHVVNGAGGGIGNAIIREISARVVRRYTGTFRQRPPIKEEPKRAKDKPERIRC